MVMWEVSWKRCIGNVVLKTMATENLGENERSLAVVLLSGGMDSCVTATLARRGHRLAVLHSSYGQRTEKREKRAFEEIAQFLGAERKLHVNQRYMTAIGGSALTDLSVDVPDADLVAAQHGEIPATYVPFRNAHFLGGRRVLGRSSRGAQDLHWRCRAG